MLCHKKRVVFIRKNHYQLLSPSLSSRVHCFHYLIPLAKEGNYAIVANVESMDYDPLVVKLNKDISAIEEAMSASLQQHKFQYIFEGQTLPLSLRVREERRVKVVLIFSLLLKLKTCRKKFLIFFVCFLLFGLKQQYLASLCMAR